MVCHSSVFLAFKCLIFLFCGLLERIVYLNSCITNESFSVLSESRMPREMEYDFLVGLCDLLALSHSFLLYRQGAVFNVF